MLCRKNQSPTVPALMPARLALSVVRKGVLALKYELGSRAEKTQEFKTMLERCIGVPVELVDERFTTLEANVPSVCQCVRLVDSIMREGSVTAHGLRQCRR